MQENIAMLTSEDIDRIYIDEDCEIFEEICKTGVLLVAKYTWPFVTGSYIIIATYMVYGRGEI